MTLSQFRDSLAGSQPPAGSSPLLEALWHEAKGDWNLAHELAQDIETADGAWVHGYLHLREGDPSNGAYWYRRAGRPVPKSSLDVEWERLATHLINSQ